MLVITRKLGEKVHIGDDTIVLVTKIENGEVRLGFDAPRGVIILRDDAKVTERKDDGCRSYSELQDELQKACALSRKQGRELGEKDVEIERLLGEIVRKDIALEEIKISVQRSVDLHGHMPGNPFVAQMTIINAAIYPAKVVCKPAFGAEWPLRAEGKEAQ